MGIYHHVCARSGKEKLAGRETVHWQGAVAGPAALVCGVNECVHAMQWAVGE